MGIRSLPPDPSTPPTPEEPNMTPMEALQKLKDRIAAADNYLGSSPDYLEGYDHGAEETLGGVHEAIDSLLSELSRQES